MAAAQAGDRIAYERLLHDCIPLIAGVARQTRVPPDRVDDVVQDTLLTVHRARHTFEPHRSFEAWLRTIAHHRAVDFIRRESRIRRREVFDPDKYENHADLGNANEQSRTELTGQLSELVPSLPPRQREAFEHIAFGQRSLAQAAADTGHSVGALKVNFHRALKTLRTRLAPKD